LTSLLHDNIMYKPGYGQSSTHHLVYKVTPTGPNFL
jgi:hypothetical protein